MRPPFPYFGGKMLAAAMISARLGVTKSYIEPFAGSLATLLYRGRSDLELVNDANGYVANFWRAVAAEPDQVKHWIDWPMVEADLRARHRWLVDQPEFRKRIEIDPHFYDAQIAGWWAWGMCIFMGTGWCQAQPGGRIRKNPLHMASVGGRGVMTKTGPAPSDHLEAVATRMRHVKVACGDWSRVVGESSLFPAPRSGGGRHPDHFAAVLLDPPYKGFEKVYKLEGSPAEESEAWALEHGEDPQIRIALCGYAGDYDLPGWTVEAWKSRGGYGLQGDNEARENAGRERVWFSPACLKAGDQVRLF